MCTILLKRNASKARMPKTGCVREVGVATRELVSCRHDVTGCGDGLMSFSFQFSVFTCHIFIISTFLVLCTAICRLDPVFEFLPRFNRVCVVVIHAICTSIFIFHFCLFISFGFCVFPSFACMPLSAGVTTPSCFSLSSIAVCVRGLNCRLSELSVLVHGLRSLRIVDAVFIGPSCRVKGNSPFDTVQFGASLISAAVCFLFFSTSLV